MNLQICPVSCLKGLRKSDKSELQFEIAKEIKLILFVNAVKYLGDMNLPNLVINQAFIEVKVIFKI